MSLAALATDYDGTIARNGAVDEATVASLTRLRAAGWRLVLATGRELEDVRRLMPALGLFDRVVAENGAVLHRPATGVTRLLGPPPPPALLDRLRAAGIAPVQAGRVAVATWETHETVALAAAAALDCNLRAFRNKGALMLLPAGVDKGSGVAAALHGLGIAPSRCVGVGDAENDLEFLALCGLPVAVANALPAVRRAARWVTCGARGAGVAELVDRLLRTAEPPPVLET